MTGKGVGFCFGGQTNFGLLLLMSDECVDHYLFSDVEKFKLDRGKVKQGTFSIRSSGSLSPSVSFRRDGDVNIFSRRSGFHYNYGIRIVTFEHQTSNWLYLPYTEDDEEESNKDTNNNRIFSASGEQSTNVDQDDYYRNNSFQKVESKQNRKKGNTSVLIRKPSAHSVDYAQVLTRTTSQTSTASSSSRSKRTNRDRAISLNHAPYANDPESIKKYSNNTNIKNKNNSIKNSNIKNDNHNHANNSTKIKGDTNDNHTITNIMNKCRDDETSNVASLSSQRDGPNLSTIVDVVTEPQVQQPKSILKSQTLSRCSSASSNRVEKNALVITKSETIVLLSNDLKTDGKNGKDDNNGMEVKNGIDKKVGTDDSNKIGNEDSSGSDSESEQPRRLSTVLSESLDHSNEDAQRFVPAIRKKSKLASTKSPPLAKYLEKRAAAKAKSSDLNLQMSQKNNNPDDVDNDRVNEPETQIENENGERTINGHVHGNGNENENEKKDGNENADGNGNASYTESKKNHHLKKSNSFSVGPDLKNVNLSAGPPITTSLSIPQKISRSQSARRVQTNSLETHDTPFVNDALLVPASTSSFVNPNINDFVSSETDDEEKNEKDELAKYTKDSKNMDKMMSLLRKEEPPIHLNKEDILTGKVWMPRKYSKTLQIYDCFAVVDQRGKSSKWH
eukprot:Awhi_evm1s15583